MDIFNLKVSVLIFLYGGASIENPSRFGIIADRWVNSSKWKVIDFFPVFLKRSRKLKASSSRSFVPESSFSYFSDKVKIEGVAEKIYGNDSILIPRRCSLLRHSYYYNILRKYPSKCQSILTKKMYRRRSIAVFIIRYGS